MAASVAVPRHIRLVDTVVVEQSPTLTAQLASPRRRKEEPCRAATGCPPFSQQNTLRLSSPELFPSFPSFPLRALWPVHSLSSNRRRENSPLDQIYLLIGAPRCHTAWWQMYAICFRLVLSGLSSLSTHNKPATTCTLSSIMPLHRPPHL